MAGTAGSLRDLRQRLAARLENRFFKLYATVGGLPVCEVIITLVLGRKWDLNPFFEENLVEWGYYNTMKTQKSTKKAWIFKKVTGFGSSVLRRAGACRSVYERKTGSSSRSITTKKKG